jgi:NADH dehydrogenase FAD-containing subunit
VNSGEYMVLGCAGISMRSSFMAPLGCLDERGAIRVNAAMQVISPVTPVATRPAVCGAGRIFALGDCVSVEGQSHTKDIYPAEAMAEVICANLRLAKTVQCLRTCPGVLHELRGKLQQMTLCSLGPKDCIFIMNGYTVSTGWVATKLKEQVEVTKMGQIRNEMWGSLVWRFVPHF